MATIDGATETTASKDLASQLSSLKRKRGNFKSRLTRYRKFISTEGNRKDIELLQVKMEGLITHFKEFDAVHAVIVDLDPAAETDHQEEYDNIEDEYQNAVADSRRLIRAAQPAPEVARIESSVSGRESSLTPAPSLTTPKIKLPVITLPTFDGNIEKWHAFREKFESRVGRNDDVPDVDKLQYLQAALSGKAARAIEAIESTGENYAEVWKILIAKYDNSRRTILRHWDFLWNFPRLQRDSPENLDELVDTFRQHLRALKGLGEPIEQWDSCIIYMLINKIGENTRFQWETTLPNNELPSYSSLMEFLEKRSSCSGYGNSRPKEAHNPKNHRERGSSKHTSSPSHTFAAITKEDSRKSYPPCVICRDEHSIYKCPKFRGFSINQRKQAVTQAALCENCLGSGHDSRNCTGGTCRVCRKKHHTYLHPPSNNPEGSSQANTLPANSAEEASQVPRA